ncbi:MAG: bifunctional UDP-sugar hydrolase/5'-nucleotidase [Verrucomicrobia bacterium]|nr:bifunctional UDP-sugar hydrolase/5'-nucleotidase [Verrucomicrobiota bacterium]
MKQSRWSWLLRCALGLSLLLGGLAGLPAREVAITILHTTDLHGHIRPADILYPKEETGNDLGGLARCATAIQRIRATTPNCLLVDDGDTFQGTTASFMSDGLMMIRAMNHIRYDAWVLGNHDFDWGREKLAQCVEASQASVLAANLHCDATAPKAVAGKVRPFVVKEVDGVRVAVVGLTTPGIPNWSRPRLIGGMTFTSSVEALQCVLPELKHQKPDVIVLAAHQGRQITADDHANEIFSITSWFPELAAIIGGHTHRAAQELMLHDVLYSQAGHWGSSLGRLDFIYDTGQRKLTSRKSRLIRMDASVPMDADILALAKPDLDAAGHELAKVIGAATEDFPITGAPARETPVHNLLCEAILDRCRRAGHPADIVVHGILDERAELKKGPITVGDCWSLVPFENFIGVFEVTPAQLREILEENAAHYSRDHFTGVYGVKLALRVTAPRGQRVVSISDRDGKPFAPDRRLHVAVNSFDLASAGTRKARLRAIADAPEAKLVEMDYPVRQALIDFIAAKKEISPRLHGWWRTGATR